MGALKAPPALAQWFWSKAPIRFGRWLPPLLFAPCLIAVEWLLVQLIFFAAHDNGEGPPGLGIALILQVLLVLGTVAVYYLGIAAALVRGVRGRLYDG